jgi:predicted ribosomally synthesized peptide with SipW-like signal peptide
MKKILYSAGLIVFVAAVALGATGAFFSDTETSTGNTFTAGAIDLQIDSQCSYNGVAQNCSGSWALKDLIPTSDKFFNFADLKPGDWGENTISLHIDNNPAWACAQINITKDADVTCTDPENADDVSPVCNPVNTGFDGDIAKNLSLAWWADDGDNVLEQNEHVFFMNGAKLSTLLNGGYVLNLTLADKNTNFFLGIDNTGNTTPLNGNQPYYVGMAWCLGDIVINGAGVVTCDGKNVNNAPQTDSLTADMLFNVVQQRNNLDFTCPDSFRNVTGG